MRRKRPSPQITPSIYRHFSAGTLALAALVAMFAEGEYSESLDLAKLEHDNGAARMTHKHAGSRKHAEYQSALPFAAYAERTANSDSFYGSNSGPGNDLGEIQLQKRRAKPAQTGTQHRPRLPPPDLPMSAGSSITVPNVDTVAIPQDPDIMPERSD